MRRSAFGTQPKVGLSAAAGQLDAVHLAEACRNLSLVHHARGRLAVEGLYDAAASRKAIRELLAKLRALARAKAFCFPQDEHYGCVLRDSGDGFRLVSVVDQTGVISSEARSSDSATHFFVATLR